MKSDTDLPVADRPVVLIVDDVPANIELLANGLSNEYEIRVATNGKLALDLLHKGIKPDLILLDIMMPEMDGFKTCQHLRTNPALKDVPVIFISALGEVTEKIKAFCTGGSDYVTKPFELEEVRARVSTHIALYRTRRELMERERRLQQSLAELEAAHAKLKEMGNQLLQSEKLAAIGQLAAGVAHEINNPIGFVNSNLGTLKVYVEKLFVMLDLYQTMETTAAPELLQQISEAKKEADFDFLREDIVDLLMESMDGTSRVRKIVQDLRDFSRPAQDDWKMTDLHACLESTLNVVRNEIKYKAELNREYSELPLVECQPYQLNQVFLNLLVNAAQAIAERGKITIRTLRQGDLVAVAVGDTGCGIPPEQRAHVFDPFYTTKPIGMGTGLGLSVAYGIVERHTGHIEVDSEPGQGTTFTVWLPINRPDAETVEQAIADK